ncbi:hypothetical protein BR93DRAFT_147548 [Coniochaeta sp. PMI_546]|nr:hypothetical protein BR93DRAFT_147548 [Coniochaeta sp. PMI_546]
MLALISRQSATSDKRGELSSLKSGWVVAGETDGGDARAGVVPIEHLTTGGTLPCMYGFTAAGQSHRRFCRFHLQPTCRVVQPRALAAASTPALAARYASVSLGRLDKWPSFWVTVMRRAHLCLISHAYPRPVVPFSTRLSSTAPSTSRITSRYIPGDTS